jgi:mannose-6-phosphate isomerase-like protein (cupin superfamily)
LEIVHLGQLRRFSRERPTRLSLFDRPRLVCDVICLEPDQQERRRLNPASDEIYFVVEGQCYLRAGAQEAVLDALTAALVPPGVEHWIANRGPGRLTVLALVAPKATRAAEVRVPGARTGPRGRRPTAEELQREESSRPQRDERPPPRDRAGPPAGRAPARGTGRGRPVDRPAGGGRRSAAPGASGGGRPPAKGRPGRTGESWRRPQEGGGRGGTGGGGARSGRSRPSGPATRSGRPAQGRSGPRTSGRRPAP